MNMITKITLEPVDTAIYRLITLVALNLKCGVLMDSALDSGSSGLDSSPCVVFLGV